MELPHEIFQQIKKIQIKANRYVQDVLAGSYHSAFKGRGMEFEDVREYQPGDEERTIDWNVTARMQSPYVKNFKEERELTVTLLIDLSASSFFGTTGKKKKTLMMEIAALIALSAVKNNDRVALLLFTDHIEKYIPPKKGTKHVLSVLKELMLFEPKKKRTDLSEALFSLMKLQKKRGVTFVLSDFYCEDFKRALTYASLRQELMGIYIRDPKEEKLPNLGLVQFKDLESQKTYWMDTRSLRVRKSIEEKNQKHIKEVKKQFESKGSGFLQIYTHENYMQTLHQFFKGRRQKT